MKRFTALLIALALIAGTVGCPATPPTDPEPTPPVQYNLTISSTAGGSVTTPGEGPSTYVQGATVDLVATADVGYRFVEWTGDVSSIGGVNAATTTITVNGDYLVTANFEELTPVQYSLTISSTAGGSVTTPGEGTFSCEAGKTVVLEARADEGYRFVSWTGEVNTLRYATESFAKIWMNTNYVIAAEFEELDQGGLFAGGNGTEMDPYRLADWHHINNVRLFLGACPSKSQMVGSFHGTEW